MNVLQNPSHVNNDSYNVFPLEQRTEFTSTVGELLPIYHDILYPGEKVTVNTILRTRTMPLDSAAFCHITEHLDWFAVPLSQLYKPFESYQFGIWDLHSDIFGDGTNPFPRADLPSISAPDFNSAFEDLATLPDPYFPAIKGTSMRLMELFDIPLRKYVPLGDTEVQGGFTLPMNLSPFLPAAYQKIYFDYYRNSDREMPNPSAYNFDSLWSGGNVPANRLQDLFTLRYRQWKEDFFTHLYTSPLMGLDSIGAWQVEDGSSPVVGQFKQWLLSSDGGSVTQINPSAADDISNPSAFGFYDLSSDVLGNDNFSPVAIRTSFAVEKLLEITRRAGKHVDQQLLAHFGVKVSSKVAGEVEHISHSSSEIMIGDVIATSASDANSFGQVGGKGYGNGSGKFKWKNDYPCPVILMCIYSAQPDVDYSVTGLGRFNTYMDNSDFFHTEFNNLGMQPQFGYQRRLDRRPDQNSLVSGWQPRWMESKCKPNRVTGGLARSLYFWTTRRTMYNVNLSYADFLVSPLFLNPIMQKDYDFGESFDWDTDSVEVTDFTGTTTPSSLFDSDPLIHEFYCHCNKASKMSTFGLPSL